jgi:CheY-like chemotaxis protein
VRVLVIEDNDMDVMVIDEVLKTCGMPMEVRVANDGEAALKCLNEFSPAVILLDLNLPKVPGLEVLAEVRRRESAIPVVIVTSSDSGQDFERAKILNATAYFCKPANLREFMNLAQIVRGVLEPPAGLAS